MKDLSEKNWRFYSIGGVPIKIILILLGITLIGYWPVSSGLFALKNDALNYFLPYRYSIGEAIRTGNLPYWSPYIYMGHPLNGDIQSGAFNPLVWLLCIFGKYTLTTLHIETLIYLFLGALGTYKLLAELEFEPQISLAISTAYLFCGFFTDNGQNISWISNAGLLPLAYLYFYRILNTNDWKNSIKLAFVMFMLFVSGYPFFIIYTSYLFLLIGIIWIIYQTVKGNQQNILLFLKQILLAVAVTLVICSAPLFHFLLMLPYYPRGSGLNLDLALTNSLPPGSLISFLFPWSVTKSSDLLVTDMSHLNSYIGILTLPLILFGLIYTKRKISIPLLAILFITIILSFGKWGWIRSWTHEHLPLMNTFRHPANFRIFTLQILLLFAAKGLQMSIAKSAGHSLRRLISFSHFGLGLLILSMILFSGTGDFGLIHKISADNLRQQLKEFHSSIGYNESMFITGCIQLLFLLAGYIALMGRKIRTYLFLFAFNLLFIGQLTIFTTFVSKSSIKDIEKIISYRKKFPIPDLEKQTIQCDTLRTYGYPPGLKYIFSKYLVVQEDFTNPSFLRSYGNFINDVTMRNHLAHYPAVYLADTVIPVSGFTELYNYDSLRIAFLNHPESQFNPTSALQKKMIAVNSFGPNRFEFSVETDKSTYLCLFQNCYPYWKASVDEVIVPVTPINHSFMGIPITAGKHQVTIKVESKKSIFTYIISFIAILTCCLVLVLKRK